MEARQEDQVFGRLPDPRVQESLPININACK